jgi:pilus assembly protein TadC
MSLKAFHIFFITLSVLLTLGFAGWLMHSYAASGDAGTLVAAIAAVFLAGALVVYARRFLRKLRHVSYI